MKDTGVIRKFDSLGRIVIPKEIRIVRKMEENDAINIFLDRKDIILEKANENDNTENKIGITRRLDELGRIVIPIEIRQRLKVETGNGMHIYLKGQEIILRKEENNCIFCGKGGKLYKILDKPICKKCENKIKDELMK